MLITGCFINKKFHGSLDLQQSPGKYKVQLKISSSFLKKTRETPLPVEYISKPSWCIPGLSESSLSSFLLLYWTLCFRDIELLDILHRSQKLFWLGPFIHMVFSTWNPFPNQRTYIFIPLETWFPGAKTVTVPFPASSKGHHLPVNPRDWFSHIDISALIITYLTYSKTASKTIVKNHYLKI